MDRKLRTKRGRTLYRQRGAAVEPVFGQMKDRQGADRFSMRGLECCRSEWQLDAAVHNLRKLHRESVHRAKTKQPSPIRRGVQYGSIGNRLRSSAASLFRSSSSPFLENQATRAPEISRPVGQRPRAGHRTSSPSPTSSALRFASRRGFGSPKGTIKTELDQAAVQSRRTDKPARRFKDFRWTTRSSWSRRRRVVAKAEWTKDEANPRFVVTSLTRAECKARYLYEKVYCARGDMENRIKECQLDLYADRTSTATMRANQLRLWFASMAYVLLCALRRIGL